MGTRRLGAATAVAGALALAALAIGLVSMIDHDSAFAGKKYTYPEAKKGNVVDDYFGHKVADPYRWLEDPNSPETQAFVAAQNKLTRAYVDSYPKREAIEARLKKLWDYPKYSLPSRHGDRYFFSKNDGLQNQSVLYVQASLDGDAKVVIDPNTLSADGTVALTGTHYTHDGTLMAYLTSASGSDRQEIRIRNVDTGKDYDEVIKWCRFAGVGWTKDNGGFWYDRFPADGEVPAEDMTNYCKVWWHKLGTPQSDDKLVFENKDNKEIGYSPFVTDDGAYLMLFVYHGTDPNNGIYYRMTDSYGEFVHLIELDKGMFNPIDNIGSTVYFHTDYKAPRGRVIAIDLANPAEANWKEIIPEKTDVIDGVSMVDDELVVNYMQDAKNKLMIFDKDGAFRHEVELPTIGSVGGISGRREDKEMFFDFTSFTYPTTTFRYDFATDKASVFHKPEIDFDGTQYETKQVFYKSKDGTRIPMFLTYKKGMKLDGKNPTLLYGYGGFNISITPSFSIARLVWLENGGILAVANIRGGNEYGEEWHQQGILDRKQNVFDDFIAAGEYLIREKYTQTKYLVINGGSNGGLLTAACTVQRPDLWGAVVCQVPVIDMLRFQKFTVGRYWVSDYGNAEESEKDFKFLYAYSPIENIKPGFKSPPILITSADTDDRVVPMHAKKFAATLQANDVGENPILLRVETRAGHGGGKPTSKQIEEAADIYSFLFKTLGIKPTTV
jgi:prolyl oligopeptidase